MRTTRGPRTSALPPTHYPTFRLTPRTLRDLARPDTTIPFLDVLELDGHRIEVHVNNGTATHYGTLVPRYPAGLDKPTHPPPRTETTDMPLRTPKTGHPLLPLTHHFPRSTPRTRRNVPYDLHLHFHLGPPLSPQHSSPSPSTASQHYLSLYLARIPRVARGFGATSTGSSPDSSSASSSSLPGTRRHRFSAFPFDFAVTIISPAGLAGVVSDIDDARPTLAGVSAPRLANDNGGPVPPPRPTLPSRVTRNADGG